jgi:hypothetical protein
MLVEEVYGTNASTSHQAIRFMVYKFNVTLSLVYVFHPLFCCRVANDLKSTHEKLNVEAFCSFVRLHHGLLFPAFQLQVALQEHVLGRSFWEKQARRRERLSAGKYMTLMDFLEQVQLQFSSVRVFGIVILSCYLYLAYIDQ